MNLRRTALSGALFCGLAMLSVTAFALQVPGSLVSTEWLSENLDQVVVLDVRKDVKSFEKKGCKAAVNPCGVAVRKGPLKVAGHIPGAVLVPWKKLVTKRTIEGQEIKVLVPDKEKFERLMRKSGVDQDSALVITGKGEQVVHTALAARLYWTLKYFGFDNVALLDGGTAQWMKEKRKLELGKSPRVEKGNFKATTERKKLLASTDDVMKLIEDKAKGQLLDTRSTAEYLGLTAFPKFVAPGVKGHVPGAKSFPVNLFANSRGTATLYDKAQVRKVADLLGVDTEQPTLVMCNSGVMASLGWFTFRELLGNPDVRLYDGSMHEWSHLGKPVVSMQFE